MLDGRPWLQRKLLQWLFGTPKLLVKYDYDPVQAPFQGGAKLKYAKAGDAGVDLFYVGEEPIVLKVGESTNVPARLSVKVPDGYVGILRCRSSAFAKRGLFIIHNTIDAGYTGTMFTTVWHPGLNGNTEPAVIQPWERLSQIIVVPRIEALITEVQEMPKTERGVTGFGSSGL